MPKHREATIKIRVDIFCMKGVYEIVLRLLDEFRTVNWTELIRSLTYLRLV